MFDKAHFTTATLGCACVLEIASVERDEDAELPSPLAAKKVREEIH